MRRTCHSSSSSHEHGKTAKTRGLFHEVSSFLKFREHGRKRHAGFTLPETIVGVVLFAMVMVGVYTGLVQSYHMQALSRYRDNARAILRSYVDQFQRLSTTTEYAGIPYSRWLFVPTGDFTGDGLSTSGLCVDDIRTYSDPGPPGNVVLTPPVEITLCSSNPAGQTARWHEWPRPAIDRSGITESYALPAELSREISYVDPATGATSGNLTIGDSGYMLQGIFRITFNYNKKAYTESLSVMRVVK